MGERGLVSQSKEVSKAAMQQIEVWSADLGTYPAVPLSRFYDYHLPWCALIFFAAPSQRKSPSAASKRLYLDGFTPESAFKQPNSEPRPLTIWP